jgi:hypothetical protein
MSLLDNLPHTCTANRRGWASDSIGGTTESDDALFSDRACWRQQAGFREITEFEKRGKSVTEKVYFTSDPGLQEEDVLTMEDGNDYEVRSDASPDATAGMGILWKVMVWRSTTGST